MVGTGLNDTGTSGTGRDPYIEQNVEPLYFCLRRFVGRRLYGIGAFNRLAPDLETYKQPLGTSLGGMMGGNFLGFMGEDCPLTAFMSLSAVLRLDLSAATLQDRPKWLPLGWDTLIGMAHMPVLERNKVGSLRFVALPSTDFEQDVFEIGDATDKISRTNISRSSPTLPPLPWMKESPPSSPISPSASILSRSISSFESTNSLCSWASSLLYDAFSTGSQRSSTATSVSGA